MIMEPIQISARFARSLESAILRLQAHAAEDERVVPTLLHNDHRRRQRLLVEGQLDRAFRLQELLNLATVQQSRAA